jgi:hypothetical protein
MRTTWTAEGMCMLNKHIGSVLVILLIGCGEADSLKKELAKIKHPSSVEETHLQAAAGLFGRGELVASLRHKSEYKTSILPTYYQEQLRSAGWRVCIEPDPSKWIEFLDKSSGVEKTKSQVTIHFSKANFEGEIRLEQERPGSELHQVIQGIGYLRITTPPSSSCK